MAAEAAALASLDGLAGITLAELAQALGVSKSSIQAAYPTKQELQLAAIAAATEIFVAAVVAPAQHAAEGLPRLKALIESWLGYVERRVFPGGCFMVATLAEFDSHSGPVRDALAAAHRGWLALLERQTAIAQAAGELPDSPPPSLLAFEIDALLSAANVSRNLSDDAAPLAAVRTLIALRLGGAPLPDARPEEAAAPA